MNIRVEGKKKYAGLSVVVNSSGPPPGPPGAGAVAESMVNPIVETPAMLELPAPEVNLDSAPPTYKPPPPELISNLEVIVAKRLADAKAKPTPGPEAVARMGKFQDDTRAK